MARGSSKNWLRRQHGDPYVEQARARGYRSRAVFKLQELDRRFGLLRRAMTVVDLGASPGGWSQYAAQRLAGEGRVFALDILPMDPLPGVDFIQGDFTAEEVLQILLGRMGGGGADLVMSDMAPNISGVRSVDQPRAMLLAELARSLAVDVLPPGGRLVVKLFQGEGFDAWVRESRALFEKLVLAKPRASRPQSREVYAVATR